jgi:hypothetical protein
VSTEREVLTSILYDYQADLENKRIQNDNAKLDAIETAGIRGQIAWIKTQIAKLKDRLNID